MYPVTHTPPVIQTNESIIPPTIQVIAKEAANAKPIEVSTAIVCYSGVIKDMLDDLGYSSGIIPIHGISHKTLTFIVRSLETIHENPNGLDQQIKDLDTQTLYDVLIAANKLDIKPLLELCTKQWANVCNEAFTQFTSYYSYQKSEIFPLSKQLPPELNIACAKQISLTPKWDLLLTEEDFKFATIHPPCTVTSLAFSPDSQQILEWGSDANDALQAQTTRVWKVSSQPSASETTPVSTYHHNQLELTCVAYSPTGKFIASGSRQSEIVILNKETGATKTIPNSHGGLEILKLAFSPDSLMLASSSYHGIKFWNSSDGKFLKEIQDPSDEEKMRVSSMFAGSPLGFLKFSPNGNVLASVIGVDKVIKVWDVARGSLITSFCKDEDRVLAFCFSPDGSRIASKNFHCRSGKSHVRIWNVEDGSQIQDIQDPDLSYLTGAIQFTADGSMLLTDRYNGLTFRDLSSERFFLTVSMLPESPNDLCLSPDGKTLAVVYKGDKSLPVNLIPMKSFEPIFATFRTLTIDQVLFFNLIQDRVLFPKRIDLHNPDFAHLAEIFAELPYEVRNFWPIYECFTKESRLPQEKAGD